MEKVEDVKKLPFKQNDKIAYVTQTTLSVDDTKDIIKEIKLHFCNVIEPKKNDICYATRPDTKPTVPLTPGLSLSLNEGDPLRSPWYPRVRPIPDHLKSEWL